jgi:hypothetical protein
MSRSRCAFNDQHNATVAFAGWCFADLSRPTTAPLVDLFALHQMMSQKQQTGLLAGLVSTAEAVASGEDNFQANEISQFQKMANRRSKQQLEQDFVHCSASQSTAVTSRIRLMLGHNMIH